MARISQKVLLVATLLLLTMGARFPAAAAQDRQAPSQQDKMKACNNMADNKGLKGDDRKNFMQSCLSETANSQPSNEMSEKDKMNACKNLADRKNLTGGDRRSFIKDCVHKANPK